MARPEEGLRPLEDEDGLEAVLRLPLVLVYKHSPLCGQSYRAMAEVRGFAREMPDVPVFVVDVVRGRPVSRTVADRTGVRHESPQVLLVKEGAVVWHASHGDVRAGTLRDAVAAAG